MNINSIASNRNGSILDVRTPEEFRMGNIPGSRNIPLNEIPGMVAQIKEMPLPLLVVCQSGGRSAQAYQFLASQGIACKDGGAWHQAAR